MTPRRKVFEAFHKAVGYSVLVLAGVTIIFGLYLANGPKWMLFVIVLWWLGLASFSVILQRRGMAVGSYQAIWGPDPKHLGNAPNPRSEPS